jgi:hypothetical protein
MRCREKIAYVEEQTQADAYGRWNCSYKKVVAIKGRQASRREGRKSQHQHHKKLQF